jgi:hypothetical protein
MTPAPGLSDITVVDVPRAADALDALRRLGDRDLVVLASPLADRLPPTTVTLDAGPDLRRVVEAGDPEGVDPQTAALEAIGRDPAWRAIVLGPDACPPTRDAAGRLLVISALGPSVMPLRRALPPAQLALDVGRDAFEGLEAAVGAALSDRDTRGALGAVVFLGLRPAPGTARRLLAALAGLPVLAWDPSARRIAAWRSLGVAATTSFEALRLAAATCSRPSETSPWPALVATSPALAALVADALGLEASSLPETVTRRLDSELPAGTVATRSPLVLPALPAAPGLPPRHHRHVAVALDALGGEGLDVVLAVASDDALAHGLASHPLAAAGHLMVVTPETMASIAEAQGLAGAARNFAASSPRSAPISALDDRLQALLLAATLQRSTAVGGGTALAIASAMTGLPAAPRSLVTTPGHAEALAKRGGAACVIGVDASMAGPAFGGGSADTAPSTATLCTTPDEVFEAFTAVAPPPPSPLAYAPRFLAPVQDDARLVTLEVRAAPIAPEVSSGPATGASGAENAPAQLRGLADAIGDTLGADDVIAAARLLVVCDAGGAPLAIVDAMLTLASPRAG